MREVVMREVTCLTVEPAQVEATLDLLIGIVFFP
jgi:hypothetical protein